MKLYPIQCGNFKLDGGAMFGVVPKSLWQKTNPADEKNLIEMGMRSPVMNKSLPPRLTISLSRSLINLLA